MEAAVEYETEEVVEVPVEEVEETEETAQAEEEDSAPQETEDVETDESAGAEVEVEEEKVEEPVKPEKSKVQRRIDRLTKKAREAEERAEQLQKELKERQGGDPQGPPSEEQFETYDEYTDALAEYKAEQKLSSLRAEEHQRAADNARIAAQHKLQAQLDVGRSKHEDFDEVALKPPMEGGPIVTETMLHAMQEGEIMDDVAYYLGKHTEEAAQIANMPHIAQVRAIAMLEMKLQTPKPAPKKVTKSPKPIKPVGSSAKIEKSVSDMTDAEYAEWRRRGR